jgi:aminoglycoside 6'-N-acetyltransferase I
VRIVDLRPGDASLVRQVAELLVEGFRDHEPEAFPDTGAALAEVRQSFDPQRLSRVAVDASGAAVGWIGGISHYRGRAWELHPMVVRSDRQRQGVGRALVMDFEERVRELGAITVWLGTDDVDARTSVSGIELYPDVLGHAARIRNLGGHPYEFYQKVGFTVVGVLPDVNGIGRPDIFMAKRVGR